MIARKLQPASRYALAAGLAAAVFAGEASAKPKVLDFWAVGGFAHGSRTAANTLLDSLAAAMGFDLVKSDQATVMTAANLASYDVVILNNSTESGKIFNTDQRAALLAYMDKKGFIGFHGSGDTKGSWPDYTTYLGGELSSHGGGIATLNLDTSAYAKASPLVKGLPAQTAFDEEWYAYKTNPRNAANVKVLYTLDESTCPNCVKMLPPNASDHPVVWVKEPAGGGRTFYYAMGHGDNIFKKNAFTIGLLARALEWTSGCAIKDAKTSVCAGVAVRPERAQAGASGPAIKNGAGSLSVETREAGAHRVELMTVGGKRVGVRTGAGVQSYTFSNLRSGAVYSVVVYGKTGRVARLVAVP
jgi:type 1 glutamine amidotransferase